MNLELYRGLLKEFMFQEERSVENVDISDLKKVGVIHFQDLEHKDKSLDFYLNYAYTGDGSDAYLMLFTDGSLAITVAAKYFAQCQMNRLMATIAHEVGHYVCTHQTNENYGRQLHNKHERLTQLSSEAFDNPDKACSYYRATLFSLLRGGVTLRESEADACASLYVPVDDLILIHTEDFSHPNKFAVQEKFNRVKWLIELKKTEVKNKLKLELKLNPTKGKKVKINV